MPEQENRPKQENIHVVFGASGGAGSAIVHELLRRGKPVRAITRSGWADAPPHVETMQADATDLAAVRAACEGAAVVYHCVNVPYPQWFALLPPIMDNLIAGAAEADARLVYIDNLYMFGEGQSPMKEDKPHHPTSRKGELRLRLAKKLLAAHEAGRVKATIGRGSDFYGPGATNSMLGERVVPAALAGETAQVIGDVDVPHTYTYLPDFAKGIVTLGEREEALGRAWHIPNDKPLTTRQMLALIYEEAGTTLQFRTAPRFLLALMGLFNPEIRELREMLYQFEAPFIVNHDDYARTFGDFTPTPPREAARATVAWYREQPE